ncbi:MAG: hypothetical protein RBJ76_28735 [Stenomitos frigidus ULC029]
MDCDIPIFACFWGTDPGVAENLQVLQTFQSTFSAELPLGGLRVYAEL